MQNYVKTCYQCQRIFSLLGEGGRALWRGKNAIGGGILLAIPSQLRRNENESSAYVTLFSFR
jgi:hypothetical protein